MSVRTTTDGAVMTIAFDRPATLNALTCAVGVSLIEALERAADPEVRCVVLTGTGRAFSAGADLKDLEGPQLPDGRPDLGAALTEVFNRPVRQLRDLEKPVIAAVNGPAVGIASSYAMACDLVVAARSAYLLLPFATIGLVPDGGASCLLPARAGVGRFNRAVLTGERIAADDALAMGLVDEVVDDDALTGTVAGLARRLAAGATPALAAAKALVNAGPLVALDEALALEAAWQGRLATAPAFAQARREFARQDGVSRATRT